MDAAKALKRRSLSLELETINASACGINDMPDDDWLEGAAVIPDGDFSIDDLLDFSNEQEEEKDSLSVSSPDNDTYSNSGSFSGNGEDSDLLLGSELVVPVEDIAEELEWVSQFVDDSLPLHQCPPPPPPIVVVCLKPPSFTSQVVPVKSRSKRSRSKQTCQSISKTSSTSSWSTTSIDLFKEKKRRKKIINRNDDDVELQRQRRCSHCLVEKTPQWRSGPLGPNSLCNACGVRYKSGRLFPEYRPACSPSFALDIHSNSHRKVLEMRRKKETGRLCYMVSTF